MSKVSIASTVNVLIRVICLTAFLVAPASSWADGWKEWKPKIRVKALKSDQDSGITGAVKLEVEPESKEVSLGPWSPEFSFYGVGTFALDHEANPDPIKVELRLDDRLTQLDFAFIKYGLNISYEGEQTFNNQNVTAGPELLWINRKFNIFPWVLVPHMYLNYSLVQTFNSDDREDLGVDDHDLFPRLALEAAWNMFLEDYTKMSIVEDLIFKVDLRYYLEHDQESAWKDKGLDEYTYVTVDLAYDLLDYKYLQEIFVRFTDGQLPTQMDEHTSVSLGVRLKY